MTGENPKEACGKLKVSYSCVPLAPIAEVAVAMMEGARKYGRHNYRASNITASIYYDACRRHIDAWFEGEDADPDSGVHHIVKAIASLLVLRDCMITGHLADDRPPKVPEGHKEHVQNLVNGVLKKFPECKDPITEGGQSRGLCETCTDDGNCMLQLGGKTNDCTKYADATGGFENE